MELKTKIIITAALVIAVIGGLFLQTTDKALFKGQLVKQGNGAEDSRLGGEGLLPDLKPEMQLIIPESSEDDIGVSVSIINEGPGSISGTTPFKYTVYLDKIEVFSNVDSYTTMEAGDSFNFVYPISRLIYQYRTGGEISVVLDVDNSVKEENEDNNSISAPY